MYDHLAAEGARLAVRFLEGRTFNAVTLMVSLASLGTGVTQVLLMRRPARRRKPPPPRPQATPGRGVLWKWGPPALATMALLAGMVLASRTGWDSSAKPRTCADEGVNAPPAAVLTTDFHPDGARRQMVVTGRGFPPSSVFELFTRPKANVRQISPASNGPVFWTTDTDGGFVTTLPIRTPVDALSCVLVRMERADAPTSILAAAGVSGT